jgi:hypothetical protein
MLDLISSETRAARGWTRVLLILGVGTMVSAWLSLWVALLARMTGSAILLPGLAQEALVLFAAALAWRLQNSALGERMIGTLITFCALVTVLIAVWARFYSQWWPFDPRWLVRVPSTQPIGPVIATVLIVLVFWWTGSRIGASRLDDYTVFRFFAIGIAGLFGALILGGHALSTDTLVIAVVVFFAAAFLTLPAAQLVRVRERGKARGARLPAVDRRWAGTAVAATLAIVLLALLLTALSSGAVLTLALSLLARIRDLLLWVLYPFALVLGYMMQALISLIQALMGHSGAVLRHPVQQPKVPRLPNDHQAQGHRPAVVHAILGGAILLVLSVVVVMVLSRAVGRLAAFRENQAFEEERESVWSWGEAGGAWQGLLGRLRGRLQRHGAARDAAIGPPRSVREAYRRLLQRAAALGHARGAPETPSEYVARLQHIPIPDEQDAALLTGAYLRVRYGEEAEQPEDIEQAGQAWARLDEALHPSVFNASHEQQSSDEG